MSELAVKVTDLTKQFNFINYSVDVLNGIDLEAKTGELLMIVGPSGSGKTTLLSIIAGTLKFSTGDVVIFGNSLKNLNESEITEFRKKNIGFIFQQFHLIKTLNCQKNIAVPLILNGVKTDEALEKASLMMNEVGMKGKEKLPISGLSGGEQQRVAIARALIHEPNLLICDEPTASLDAQSGNKVMNLIVEIAKSPKRCVIVVTHDNRIFKFADRVIYMNDGVIIKEEKKEKENGYL